LEKSHTAIDFNIELSRRSRTQQTIRVSPHHRVDFDSWLQRIRSSVGGPLAKRHFRPLSPGRGNGANPRQMGASASTGEVCGWCRCRSSNSSRAISPRILVHPTSRLVHELIFQVVFDTSPDRQVVASSCATCGHANA